MNPLLEAILAQANSGSPSGGGVGGDPSLMQGAMRTGGDPSLLQGAGGGGGSGGFVDSRMQHAIKGVPGPGGDAIWGFNGTVDPFGEVKFG